MLPKEYRLPKQIVPIIFSRGRRLSTKFGVFIFIKNEVNTPRFLIIVSKKSTKKSTERNRIKRLLRESIRAITPSLTNNRDAIFLSKFIDIDTHSATIQEVFKTHLQ